MPKRTWGIGKQKNYSPIMKITDHWIAIITSIVMSLLMALRRSLNLKRLQGSHPFFFLGSHR